MSGKKQKKDNTMKHVILIIVVILVITFSTYIYGAESIFAGKLKSPIDNIILNEIFKNSVIQYIYSSIPNMITTYFVICATGYLNRALQYTLTKAFNQSQRAETILKMLFSFSKYGFAIIAGLIILTVWGADSGALLASAGGLALVVGLGAQSLIADVLAGVFIVFEGEFNVGDIVIIDGYRGKVLAIGIRSTKFRDIYGDIKTINNSQITTVINKTKEVSMADVTVGINYGESIEKVEAIFKKELKKLKEKIPEALEEIVYLGVTDLGASSVDLLFITYAKEEHVMSVRRKIRRELKVIFDNYGIEIPYQHITLERRDKFESGITYKPTAKELKQESNDIENLLFNKEIPKKLTEEEIKAAERQKAYDDRQARKDLVFDEDYTIETIEIDDDPSN
ncbi:MAG: mechanosensitive ion channel family protein [bacterium]